MDFSLLSSDITLDMAFRKLLSQSVKFELDKLISIPNIKTQPFTTRRFMNKIIVVISSDQRRKPLSPASLSRMIRCKCS